MSRGFQKGHKINLKHGMEGTRTYRSWKMMKNRCLNKNDDHYKNYGGRGITVYYEWLEFINFFRDMGERPLRMSIDRIDNNKGYCKENCRWATEEQQHNNTRVNVFLTYKNKTLTIIQWARKLGIKKDTFWRRLNNGWSIEKAIKTKVRKCNVQ